MRCECGEDEVDTLVKLLSGDGVGAKFARTPQNAVESQLNVMSSSTLLCVCECECECGGGGREGDSYSMPHQKTIDHRDM